MSWSSSSARRSPCCSSAAVIDVSGTYGSNYVAPGFTAWDGFLMEAVLTLGLVSVILGTASGAQNIGIIGAFGVGAYIALAGLWGSPISGASMNPARTFGPDLVGKDFSDYWVYVAGPLTGAVLAVGAAWILRGAGGGKIRVRSSPGSDRHRGRAPRQGLANRPDAATWRGWLRMPHTTPGRCRGAQWPTRHPHPRRRSRPRRPCSSPEAECDGRSAPPTARFFSTIGASQSPAHTAAPAATSRRAAASTRRLRWLRGRGSPAASGGKAVGKPSTSSW